MKNPEKFKGCANCDAKCCKHVAIQIDDPEDWDDFENIKWYIMHQNMEVFKDNEGDWLVEFKTPCKFLGEHEECKAYDYRPKVCRDYTEENCVLYGEGDYYEERFLTVEDVEAYKRKHGIKNEGWQGQKERQIHKLIRKK